MNNDSERTIEVTVLLRLSPAARDALVREAAAAHLSVDEAASVMLEVRLVDRDPIEAFQTALERAGVRGEEFAEAWREGQEELRGSPREERGGGGE